jgi:hypothetical protein
MVKSNIKSKLYKHDINEICLGDIVKDITIKIPEVGNNVRTISFPFAIIVSQSCDLEQGMSLITAEEEPYSKRGNEYIKIRRCNPFLPNVMVLPLFNDEELKQGKHLIDAYNVLSMAYSGDLWKRIKKNHDPRFHYLEAIAEEDIVIPSSVIDFKIYFSYPYELLVKEYKNHYQISLSELFRESFSQRFVNYISRIGLPELKPN